MYKVVVGIVVGIDIVGIAVVRIDVISIVWIMNYNEKLTNLLELLIYIYK